MYGTSQNGVLVKEVEKLCIVTRKTRCSQDRIVSVRYVLRPRRFTKGSSALASDPCLKIWSMSFVLSVSYLSQSLSWLICQSKRVARSKTILSTTKAFCSKTGKAIRNEKLKASIPTGVQVSADDDEVCKNRNGDVQGTVWEKE